jgi:hypothetical protein
MPRTRILCVGEGDLTFSLALARAYGTEQLHITATTLLQKLSLRNWIALVSKLHLESMRLSYTPLNFKTKCLIGFCFHTLI